MFRLYTPILVAILGLTLAPVAAKAQGQERPGSGIQSRQEKSAAASPIRLNQTSIEAENQEPLQEAPKIPAMALPPTASLPDMDSLVRSIGSFAIFGLVSLLPTAILTLTAFIRISVVLVLVRQALGSLQVPGNQALSALALLLTLLVMAPVGQRVYSRALLPLWQKQATPEQAWIETSEPVKAFMIEQICRTGHQNYLWSLYSHTTEATQRPEPKTCEEFPLQVIAPAFLISELTTALYLGFAVFLPFLVVDLVVSAVLSAMGLFLMPPTLVALPIKLALFVLADGWMLVAEMLLRSFGTVTNV